MEEILRVLDTSKGQDFDDVLEILYNLTKAFDGGVAEGYASTARAGMVRDMVNAFLAELELHDDVEMAGSKHKDKDVKIPWEEGRNSSDAGRVGPRQFCRNLSAAQWASLIYNHYKDSLSAEDIALLEEYAGINLEKDGIARASKAVQRDPLIIDLNENHLYSTTLQDGAYYDYGEDGMKEKTA